MASLLVMKNFIGILRETYKIFIKNCKIFASIALFTLLISSIGYLCNFYSIKPLLTDLLIEGSQLSNTDPSSPQFTEIIAQIKKDSKSILCFEFLFFTISSAFFLLSTTATILAAAITYSEKEQHLSLKDLLYKTVKSWLGPLFTWLHILFFTFLYFFIFGVIMFLVAMITQNPTKLIFVAIPLGIFAAVLYMYFSVTWTLAIVVSAVEKVKGMKAIGKAGEIVKEMKLQGFMVNVLLNILTFVLQLGVQLIPLHKISLIVVRGVVVVYLSSLVSIYHFAAYVVIYYMCKKNHGQSVELEGSGYSKVPTTPPLVDDKLP